MSTNDQFVDLIWRAYEGELDETQAAELTALIEADPNSRQLYVQFMLLYTNLRWERTEGELLSNVQSISAPAGLKWTRPVESVASIDITTQETEPKKANQEGIGDLPRIHVSAVISRRNKRLDSIHWQRHKIRFNAMTAVLTALAWVGFSFFVWSTTTPDDSRPNRDGINVNFVAHITGQHEHQWVKSTRGIPPFAFLVPGERLDLVEGLIEITFFDGAVVVLEGPTEFVIDSPGAGTLDTGRLAAMVPEGAEGFSIRTPTAVIVDLGTAFGVSVDPQGVSDVTVFEGRVEMGTAGQRQQTSGRRILEAGSSARIAPDAEGELVLQEIPSGPAFARYLPQWGMGTRNLVGLVPMQISEIQVFDANTSALNNRGDQQVAIDGDLNTFSFLTPAETETPQIVTLDLGGSETVCAIRVAKVGDCDRAIESGAPGLELIDNMDLQILFTTDSGPLNERTYTPVSGLCNSVTEPINADSIDSETASIDNDHHNYATDGWYMLRFDSVRATAVAIRFARDEDDSQAFTHYRVFEFQTLAPSHPISPVSPP